MKQYSYDGPVMELDICIRSRWKASTYATSEDKARCNLTYRYKKENNIFMGKRIRLPGKLVIVENKEETKWTIINQIPIDLGRSSR